MPSLLTGFVALLVGWLVQFRGVLAQDGNHYDGGDNWGSDSNNVTMCGESDFYNSTAYPYSCEFVWEKCEVGD